MELIVINETQIKLTLTPDDLERYPPTVEEGELFRAILHDATRIETEEKGSRALPPGFTDRGGKLFVQMYPSRRGGCELFVTRLPPSCSSPDGYGSGRRADDSIRGGSLRRASDTLCGPGSFGRRAVYLFGELDLLLRCCSALARTADGDSLSGSAAFADRERRTYYLLLPAENPTVCEYLGSLCPSGTVSYIQEHCVPLCGSDAVRRLGELA
ncbi:MAG: adaptor protein MecA [Ruminococcaceae bacterium]|nr:adaptor protein MecA [Oscillospiraceae bacterium]